LGDIGGKSDGLGGNIALQHRLSYMIIVIQQQINRRVRHGRRF
jgi:hypothetical protein